MPFSHFHKLFGKLRGVFSRIKKTDTSSLEQILLEADVGAKYTTLLIDDLAHNPQELKKHILKLVDIAPRR